VSGNPSGHSGEYGVAIKLAQRASPTAMRRLIELMDSEDERVAAVACNAILDRAFGRPKVAEETKDSLEERIRNMSREQRLTRMAEILASVRKYQRLSKRARAAPAESGA
jgi:hypothetical protein